MAYIDAFFSREARYSIGSESETRRRYLSIPVSNGVVDYEEYYELDATEYDELLRDADAAVRFAESCRNRREDDRLIEKPGWNRGTPV
jgi:hypothetical protein